MSFPESRRLVFRENPLVEVICQLTFPSILAIAAELPAPFQERVRDVYPIYSRVEPVLNMPAGLAKLLAELPVAVSQEAFPHRFSSEDESASLTLSSEFLAISVNNYSRWEVFRQAVEHAKQALEDVYRPAFYSRVGLRYRDVIDRERLGLADVPWVELLSPAVLGVLADQPSLRGGVRSLRGETFIALDDPQGASVRLVHGLLDGASRDHFTVDADWFLNERSATDAVFVTLDKFNRQAGDLFRWAIEPRLGAALGERDD